MSITAKKIHPDLFIVYLQTKGSILSEYCPYGYVSAGHLTHICSIINELPLIIYPATIICLNQPICPRHPGLLYFGYTGSHQTTDCVSVPRELNPSGDRPKLPSLVAVFSDTRLYDRTGVSLCLLSVLALPVAI